MLPVRADTRIQYRLELVFFYGDSSRHADCDVGEEELSVDGEGHAVAACVGGIADDSGTTFACTFATRPFLSGNVFGVGIGAITMCIRLWGAYPEGMSFAILIMNAVVPLINKYVKPRRFGLK